MHPHEFGKLKADERRPCNQGLRRATNSRSLTAVAQNAATPSVAEDDGAMLTTTQVRAYCGYVSAMCIWRWLRDPRVNFPTPITINRRNYWRIGDLRRWQEAQRIEQAT
ncbi:MAG: hypothetical protein WA864_08435 [Acetobacteraceae bacterium]|jgi:hypothetical protein